MGLGGSHRSTSLMNQTRYDHLSPVVILFHSFCFTANRLIDPCLVLLSSRLPLSCIRCPTGRRHRLSRRKEVEVKVKRSGNRMAMRVMKMVIPMRKRRRKRRRKSRLPILKGDPSFPMTLQSNVARGLRLLYSRPSVLGRPLRHRLRKRRSNLEWRRQSRRRPCRR